VREKTTNKIIGKLAVAICFVFGHRYYHTVTTGEVRRVGDSRFPMFAPVTERRFTDFCTRCGKRMSKSK
jgi:hypothetical protein